jgi:transcriptional regulator with XRE-family HTH domain
MFERRTALRLDGNKVRRARERLGYSMEVAGEQAEVSKNSILRAEHGEDIRPVTARRIARALAVEVADLIEESARPLALDAEETEAVEEEGRRIRHFLQEHPYQEHPEYRSNVLRIHSRYNELLREVEAALRDKDVKVLGMSTILRFFNTYGLEAALWQSGLLPYMNAVLAGEVEASDADKETWREFGKKLDIELVEAQKRIEDLHNLAREQRIAADEVEQAMPDIEAYLAGIPDSGGGRSNAPTESQ